MLAIALSTENGVPCAHNDLAAFLCTPAAKEIARSSEAEKVIESPVKSLEKTVTAKKALKLDQLIFEENHPSIARDYNNYGLILADAANYEKALQHFQKALSIYQNSIGTTHLLVANIYSNMGSMYSLRLATRLHFVTEKICSEIELITDKA